MEGANTYRFCNSCGKPIYKIVEKVNGYCEVCFLFITSQETSEKKKKGKKR